GRHEDAVSVHPDDLEPTDGNPKSVNRSDNSKLTGHSRCTISLVSRRSKRQDGRQPVCSVHDMNGSDGGIPMALCVSTSDGGNMEAMEPPKDTGIIRSPEMGWDEAL